MSRYLSFPLLILILFSCRSTREPAVSEETLLASLNALEDVSATELDPVNGYARLFAIDLTLPVDHNSPDGATFTQRMYLSHSSLEAPMVLHLSGYAGSKQWVIELCNTLRANQLLIPHRGYEEALIEPMQWEHLTIEQAAADNHRIVELMREIYRGEWISTGLSKGRMSALFLEYLYPEDADVVVAYAAPMTSGYPDQRIWDFVHEQGGDSVQAAIRKFQRTLLENRDSSMFYFREYADARDLTYARVDMETALELGVMEYAIYLWQYKNGDPYFFRSDSITIREMFRRWAWTTNPALYSDQYKLFSNLFYYQAFTEFGYYDLDDEPVADLLEHAGRDGLMLFIPDGEDTEPDFEKMDRITQWLESSGDRIIYIYGGVDPWTAGQVDPGPGPDALKVVQPGANHGVKIKECNDKSLIYDKLDQWLEAPVNRL